MKNYLLIFLFFFFTANTYCQNYQILDVVVNGKSYSIEYLIHKHKPNARKVIKQDFVTFHLQTRTELDSILKSTYKEKPIVKEISLEDYKYLDKGFMEAILLQLCIGDSATFLVNSDIQFEAIKRKRPPFIKAGSMLKYIIKVLKVQNELEVQNDKKEVLFQQQKADEKLIAPYIAKTKLPFKKTYSGIWYLIEPQGEGDFAVKDDVVAVKYIGKFLDGKEFNSSDKDGRLFEFPVSAGIAIKAFDEVLMLLKKGAKCTFITPSYLAYGTTGFGGMIPPNTPLVYEVEFTDIISRKIIIEDKNAVMQEEKRKKEAEEATKKSEEERKADIEKDLKKRGLNPTKKD
jgi:FKBP-type peptidyl-prolyl cis-trans isomerase